MPELNSIDEVKSYAMKESKFFEALLENPEIALENKFKLSDEDLETLKLLLKIGTIQLNAKEFLACMGVKGSKSDIPPKGAWA